MTSAKEILDNSFLEMRWRCLSLAADLDRIERADGGQSLLRSDPRMQTLRKALDVVLRGEANRAEQIQLIFSDMSPAPTRTPKLETRNPK